MGESLAAGVAAVFERYGIVSAYAFGSRAQEARAMLAGSDVPSERSNSDLDVGVLPHRSHKLSAQDKVRIAAELEDLFDVGRVDLVVLPEASSLLAVDIIDGERLYASDGLAAAEYELYVLRRAADLAPFQRARTEAILTGGAQ